MTVMSGNLYRALKQANVPDDMAQKAAEEVANYDQQLSGIRLVLSSIRGELTLLKWMLGVQFAGVAALVLKTFFA